MGLCIFGNQACYELPKAGIFRLVRLVLEGHRRTIKSRRVFEEVFELLFCFLLIEQDGLVKHSRPLEVLSRFNYVLNPLVLHLFVVFSQLQCQLLHALVLVWVNVFDKRAVDSFSEAIEWVLVGWERDRVRWLFRCLCLVDEMDRWLRRKFRLKFFQVGVLRLHAWQSWVCYQRISHLATQHSLGVVVIFDSSAHEVCFHRSCKFKSLLLLLHDRWRFHIN